MLQAPMGGMALRVNSILGPFPVMIKETDVPFPMRNPQPVQTMPAFLVPNRLNGVDRSVPLPPLRSVFQPERISSGIPLRLPFANMPVRTMGVPFPQIQRPNPFRMNVPSGGQEMAPHLVQSPFNVEEQNLLNQRRFGGADHPSPHRMMVPQFSIPQRSIHAPHFSFPERKFNPVQSIHSNESEESDESEEDSDDRSGPAHLAVPKVPLFRVPRPMVSTPAPATNTSTTAAHPKIPSAVLTPPAESDDVPRLLPVQSAPVPVSGRPVTLPFLQVSNRQSRVLPLPAGPGERSAPAPVRLPFLKVLHPPPADGAAAAATASPKRDQSERPLNPVTLFERLMGSLMAGSRPQQRLMVVTPPTEARHSSVENGSDPRPNMPNIARLNPSIRSAASDDQLTPLVARGLRLPLDAPHFQNGRSPIVAQPFDGFSAQQNHGRSHCKLQHHKRSIKPVHESVALIKH